MCTPHSVDTYAYYVSCPMDTDIRMLVSCLVCLFVYRLASLRRSSDFFPAFFHFGFLGMLSAMKLKSDQTD